MEENIVLEQDLETSAPETPTLATSEFAQDVARYFKTFLETDLRGQLQPARQVRRARLNGLSTQLYLNKYPQLNKNLTKNFVSGFAQEAFVISQNKYVTHGEERLSELFARAIEHLDANQMDQLAKAFARTIDLCRVSHAKDYGAYLTASLDLLHKQFASDLIVPMLRSTQTKQVADSEADELPLQVEAVEKVYGSFNQALQDVVERYYREHQSFDALFAA